MLDAHGKAVAEHVASFEARNVEAIEELVQQECVDCDFEKTKVHDVCFYDAGREQTKSTLAKLVEAGISTAKEVQYHSGTEAEVVCLPNSRVHYQVPAFMVLRRGSLLSTQVSDVKGALSCLTYNAARLWPYKLVAHLLRRLISQGVHLQTFTPVASVLPSSEDMSGYRWLVQTSRGTVKTKFVVYATNGYTSALVPEMKDKIVPVRGMVARLAGENTPKLNDSYLMRFSEHEYDYMIPRPDGSIVLGGARRDFFKNLDEWFDVTDDSKLIESARGYFDGYMQRHFLGWKDSGVRTEETWTGSKSHTYGKTRMNPI